MSETRWCPRCKMNVNVYSNRKRGFNIGWAALALIPYIAYKSYQSNIDEDFKCPKCGGKGLEPERRPLK